MSKNEEKTFYVCWLLENLGRRLHKHKSELVKEISRWRLDKLYELDDVYHCMDVDSVVDDLIEEFDIHRGMYNPLGMLNYRTPGTDEIARTYANIIKRNYDDDITGIIDVFDNPVVKVLEDYNTAMYYSDQDFISACFRMGNVKSEYYDMT